MRTATLRRQRDDATIEALFRAEFVSMVRLAYRLVGNSHEAEEVVQYSFAEIHRRFDELKRPGAYLRTTVVLRCRSVLRRRRVMQSITRQAGSGHIAQGARIMSEFTDAIDRDLHLIADNAAPSPNAWAEFQHRIATQENQPEMELIMLDEKYLLQADWESAVGWQFSDVKCDAGSPDRVVCSYSIQDSITKAHGLGPYPGNSFLIQISQAQIVGVTHNFNASS